MLGAISTAQGAGARFDEGACLAWAAGDGACEIISGRSGMRLEAGGEGGEGGGQEASKVMITVTCHGKR